MIIIIILYYLIAFTFLIHYFKRGILNANNIFIIMQLIMFTGILTFIDFSYKSDIKYIFIYFLALISFILGTAFSTYFYKTKNRLGIKRGGINKLNKNQKIYIVILVLISVLISFLYFYRAGYNVFIQILKSLKSSSVGNYTDQRLELTGISGVGYVYQFRVVILPLLVAFLVTNDRYKGFKNLGILLTPVMLTFILGTGQRAGFVVFILIWTVSLIHIYRIYREKKIKIMLICILLFSFIIFSLLTIFNGRILEGSNLLSSVLGRVFGDNQRGSVIGFRYINSQPIQYGKDWMFSLLDIFPGKSEYTQIAYKIFEIMYGSQRGTAPPCIWGSTYYNWGILGIIIFPFILGFLYNKLYNTFVKNGYNKLRIFIYSAMFVVLGSWIADSPVVLFNQGFVTLLFLRFILVPNKKIKIGDLILVGD